MNRPQTLSKKLLKIKHLENISKYGCCAFVYLWCLGIEPEDTQAIEILDDAINDRKIEEDCTVKWAEFGTWLTGRTITVDFIDIHDIRKIKERTPVRYDYKGCSHWVGVENGKVEFDPLGKDVSQCVKFGKPVTMRKIIIKGVCK